MSMIVSRPSIWRFIVPFVIYLICHLTIALALHLAKKNVKENPDNKEYKNVKRVLEQSFKWFPFAYVFLLLLLL